MKQTLAFLLKFAVALGIFVAIFLEFGGGYAPVRTAELTAPGTFEAANPDYPGLVGRLRARVQGTPLPSARVPLSLHDVCLAAAERPVFVRTADGSTRRFKPLRHCGEGGLVTVFAPAADGSFTPVPLAEAPGRPISAFRASSSCRRSRRSCGPRSEASASASSCPGSSPRWPSSWWASSPTCWAGSYSFAA